MDFNTPNIRQGIIDCFPNLKDDSNFSVVSPFTYQYNCIAWAMGIQDRWVDGATMIPWHWWPKDALNDGSEASLIDAFKKLSFVEADDDSLEEGFDKVALYSKDSHWTHAARVYSDDKLHSKLGALNDAYHSKGDVLDNLYGNIYKYMKRPVSLRHVSNEIAGESAGEIHTCLPGTDFSLVFYKGSIFDEHGREYVLIGGKLQLKK